MLGYDREFDSTALNVENRISRLPLPKDPLFLSISKDGSSQASLSQESLGVKMVVSY
jgi:hypothetical protein